jgi:hypothetical protein
MILEIGDNQGHVVIDNETGTILSVLVLRAVEGKSDGRAFYSYTNHKNGKHTRIKLKHE